MQIIALTKKRRAILVWSMIEYPTRGSTEKGPRRARRDLAKGGQINDIGSCKSRFGPVAGGREGKGKPDWRRVGSISGLPIDGPRGVQLALV